jgi:hypothetical protein
MFKPKYPDPPALPTITPTAVFPASALPPASGLCPCQHPGSAPELARPRIGPGLTTAAAIGTVGALTVVGVLAIGLLLAGALALGALALFGVVLRTLLAESRPSAPPVARLRGRR